MDKNAKIYVAGHRGLVGSAIVRLLQKEGYTNLLTRTRQELDLLNQNAVAEFFKTEKPDYVFLAAAKVGGIIANDIYPAEFIYENLVIETNIIHAAYEAGVLKLLFLGSSCIYPKFAEQPIKEEYFMTGALEPTNAPYAVAKIAGIYMCQAYRKQYGANFISVMPTNLYGPGDNFDLETSHVLPAMIAKFHKAKIENAKEVVLWGSGTPRRDFLHVDDLAAALLFLMGNYNESDIINIGSGEDIAIKDLAGFVKDVVGFTGEIVWDSSKPDGTPRKVLDVSNVERAGWKASMILEDGIRATYDWCIENDIFPVT